MNCFGRGGGEIDRGFGGEYSPLHPPVDETLPALNSLEQHSHKLEAILQGLGPGMSLYAPDNSSQQKFVIAQSTSFLFLVEPKLGLGLESSLTASG